MVDVQILDKDWVAKSKPLFWLDKDWVVKIKPLFWLVQILILDKDSNPCFGLYRFFIRIGLLKLNQTKPKLIGLNRFSVWFGSKTKKNWFGYLFWSKTGPNRKCLALILIDFFWELYLKPCILQKALSPQNSLPSSSSPSLQTPPPLCKTQPRLQNPTPASKQPLQPIAHIPSPFFSRKNHNNPQLPNHNTNTTNTTIADQNSSLPPPSTSFTLHKTCPTHHFNPPAKVAHLTTKHPKTTITTKQPLNTTKLNHK